LRKKLIINILQVITMLFWVSFLKNSDAYYIPYLIIGIISFICLYINCFCAGYEEKKACKGNRLVQAGAWIFSIIAVAANYQMYLNANCPDYAGTSFRQLYKASLILLLITGGYFIAWNILYVSDKKLKEFCWKKNTYKIPPLAVFIIPFITISILNIILLFGCKYPGNLTPDSISQTSQLMQGSYSNHHPFYHTMVIKLFVTIGLKIFGGMNEAVALYHVFQILFMAVCFSMVVFTAYETGISLKAVITAAVWYAIMPFNIMYSFTMWKDIMFGGFVVLFLTFIYRLLKNVGKYKIFNYIMFVVPGLGVCLFRSNGFFAFVIAAVTFFVLFWKTEKKICISFAGIIVLAFLMKHLALSNLGVNQPDTVEALSVPLQQVARTVIEHNDFTQEERETLNNIVDISAIPEIYKSYISDPVKGLIRSSGNQQYIIENKWECIKLYITIGLRHPLTYIRAWIDETKGFWNSGYSYWRWADGITENEYGIVRTVNSEFLNRCLNGYLWLFSENNFLQLFLCIGFHVWVVLFLCFTSIIKKDKTGLLITVSVMAVVFSLLISTPVYAEFRYAYSVFCSIPFLVFAVLDREGGKTWTK